MDLNKKTTYGTTTRLSTYESFNSIFPTSVPLNVPQEEVGKQNQLN